MTDRGKYFDSRRAKIKLCTRIPADVTPGGATKPDEVSEGEAHADFRNYQKYWKDET